MYTMNELMKDHCSWEEIFNISKEFLIFRKEQSLLDAIKEWTFVYIQEDCKLETNLKVACIYNIKIKLSLVSIC